MRRLVLLAAALLAGVFVLAGCASPASSSSLSPGSMLMPDYRGQTAGNAAAAIRSRLGQAVSVSTLGGDAAANATVTGTDPVPGTAVSATTSFTLYTTYVTSPATTEPTTEPPATTETPAPTYDAPYVPDPDPYVPAPKVHTGHSGHPCLPHERDGDHDGYCGEGK